MEQAPNKRFIAFLDILGFSRLVENSTQQEIIEKFHKVFMSILVSQYRRVKQNALKLICAYEGDKAGPLLKKIDYAASIFENGGKLDNKKKLDVFLSDNGIFNYLIVSDSIIIYSKIITKDDDIVSIFDELAAFVRELIAQSLISRLPLRGALSYGEF